MARQLTYSKRDFAALRQEQIDYLKKYYPDVFQDYTDASVLSALIDLNAGIADNLHYHIDRSLQETVLDYAQEKQSIFNIAKTYGVKLPTRSSSMAVVEVSVTVPVLGQNEDSSYLPILRAGSRFGGGGESFELLDDINFNAPFNAQGAYDRTKVPNYVNGKISSYTVTKKGLVVNGYTNIYSKRFTVEPGQFYQITLPDNNVISIESVITKPGVNYTTNPTYDEFNNPNYKWYEVDSLVENQIFVVDETKGFDPKTGLYYGEYQEILNRFVKEFSPEGYCTLTFGSSTEDSNDILDDFIQNSSDIKLTQFLNNKSLGNAPRKNTTLYVKYRMGGGKGGNVGIGVIAEILEPNMVLNGVDPAKRTAVRDSLTVRNITPSMGGSDLPTIEELRNMVAYNFASQNRAVTLDDYKAIIQKMPSKFGRPAKVGVKQIQNKIQINLLGYDENGKLSNLVPSVIMNNIAAYLTPYRMINDFIEVRPAKIIDIAVEATIQVAKENSTQIVSSVISAVNNVFKTMGNQLGKDLYVNDVRKAILTIEGVLGIESINFINKIGLDYSEYETPQPFTDSTKKIIDITDGIIYADESEIIQMRYPENDIIIKTRILQPTRNV